MTEFNFDDFAKQIKEFQRQLVEEKTKALTEIITRYDFMVGSRDLKGMLETILPKGAKIVYTPFIENTTAVYAIKKFDMMDYLDVKPNFEAESETDNEADAKEMEYNGYSSRDAEPHYACPRCGKDYGSWSFVNGVVNVTDHKFRCQCGTLLKVPK